MQPITMIIIYFWDVFPCQLVWVETWSEFCIGTAEDLSRFFKTMHVKDQVLGNVFGGTFSDFFDRISHGIHIVRTTCSQLLARSGIFCLLTQVVYWPCGLEFVYSTTNLAFLRIIVKVKLPAKLCLHCFEWFCLQIFFALLSKTLWWRINCYYFILFSNLKQRKRTQHYY